MRIRHILPQLAMGMLPEDPLNAPLTGVVGVAWQLAARQAALGHTVEIVGPAVGRPPPPRQVAGVHVSWLPNWRALATPRYDFSYLAPLALFGARSAPVDVAHVHANPFLLAPARGSVRILHYHNEPLWGSRQYARSVARADSLICCSDYLRGQVLSATGYAPQRAHTILNGVDRLSYGQVTRAEARAAYGLRPDQLAVLYVGRIGPEKGLDVLVEALALLQSETGQAPLLLVAGSATLGYEGHARAWPELQAYERSVVARAAALPVRFLGKLAHTALAQLYSAADIFVCPSVYAEPFGMVNVEAAASGLPVIASAVGGIPEAVRHAESGLLVPPGDPSALRDALRLLAAEPTLRARLGRRGYEQASLLDWSHVVRRVLDVYAEARRSIQGSRPARMELPYGS